MSETAAPTFAGEAAGGNAQGLTPETIEAILADFRGWLGDVAAGNGALPPAPEKRVDLHALIGQFVALRHEVNLQTRAVRAQQEQNAQTLDSLKQSLEMLDESQASAEELDRHAQQFRQALEALKTPREPQEDAA